MVLVHIVHVEAKAETKPFVDAPRFGEGSLCPDDPRRFEGIAPKRTRSERIGIAESVDVQVSVLRGERKTVGANIDVSKLNFIVRRNLNGAVAARKV